MHRASGRFWKTRFLARYLAEYWKKAGVEVFCAHGPDQAIDADIGLLHVDTTRVESVYADCMQRYPIALNAGVLDISKRSFSRQLLAQDDAYTGPVVVKTNNNYGGIADATVEAPQRRLDAATAFARRPWESVRLINPKQYPIFESLAEVPEGVWRNPHLIVEKLLTEQDEEGNYRLRFWYFLGDREVCELCTARKPIVKGKTIFRRELFQGVPEELREIRAELGFDFGKFDYAMVDGRPVLYDINRTPTFGPIRVELFTERGVEGLSRGLDAYRA